MLYKRFERRYVAWGTSVDVRPSVYQDGIPRTRGGHYDACERVDREDEAATWRG